MKNATSPVFVSALAFIASAMTVAASANAAVITGVTIEDFSSERTGRNRQAVKAINGVGFDPINLTHDNERDTGWQSDKVDGVDDTTPDITFDLGDVYLIDSFTVWNYNHSVETSSGYQGVIITYGETLALGSTLTEVTNFSQADGTDSYTGETFSGFTPFSARYIKFDATSNYGNARTGLAEVRFNEIVPEPSSAALGVLGLCALLAVRRRR